MGTFLEKNGRLSHQKLFFDLLPKYYSNKQSEIVCVKLWNESPGWAKNVFEDFFGFDFLAIFRFWHFGHVLLFFLIFSFSCALLAHPGLLIDTFSLLYSECFSD